MVKVELTATDPAVQQYLVGLVSLAKRRGVEARYIEGPDHIVVKVEPQQVSGGTNL